MAWGNTILVGLALLLVARASDYCSVCRDHTMCLYKARGPRCRGLYTRDLSAAEKYDALDAHNAVRNWVAGGQEGRGRSGAQPSAANMHKLRWDDELAAFAKRWASQCQFKHDTCRSSADGTHVGQNIYMQQASALGRVVEVREAVLSWYNEVNQVDGRSTFKPYSFDFRTGHYTQLVWADTTRVGCGFADFKDGGAPSRLIVCNYKQGGNVLGTVTYRAGPAASDCGPGSAAADPYYPALCV